MTATDDRESRLRRSLKRLGYVLVDAERGNFYIRRSLVRSGDRMGSA
jgi:hypothetical protein